MDWGAADDEFVNMSVLRPFYQALASGRHLNELIVFLLVVGLLFDGYAVLSLALAFHRWLHGKFRDQDPVTRAHYDRAENR